MKLSTNFELEEFLQSQTAIRKGIKEQFTPSQDVIDNLKDVCVNILEPIRNWLKSPVKISSGYRCEKLNKSIGGAKNSQHTTGEAVDIDLGRSKNLELLNWIKGNLEFDQLLNEYPNEKGEPSWVHVSFTTKRKNRKQFLVIK